MNVARQVKNRQQELDIDYWDKLTPKEKEWLNSFLEETVITNFAHKGKKLIKTKKGKREAYNRNNARNRDLLNMAQSTGLIRYSENLNDYIESQQKTNPDTTEDCIIDILDWHYGKKTKKES